MITRKHLRLDHAIRYSWKNIVYSSICWALAYASVNVAGAPRLDIPIPVVAILGTALAIILGFRNSSAYERWWEARKIWGGVVNESRSFTRQLLVFAHRDPFEQMVRGIVLTQIAWMNALRLQLRQKKDERLWAEQVYAYLRPEVQATTAASTNKVTRLGFEQGRSIKALHDQGVLETLLLVQLDDTLTRLTDLQGRAERIANTPLPRPYDYYTLAFLHIFIFFLPFGLVHQLEGETMYLMLLPITIIVGWIFYQIYVFGKVLSHPFQNWRTDVPLDAITRTIEIDLKEMLGEANVPAPAQPVNGVLM